MTTTGDGAPSFLVIGAGGLGGPILYALAAAGAGRLVVVDDDDVDESNLQRQVQFATADVGRRKVDAVVDELARRGYPRDRIEPVVARVDAEQAPALIARAAVDVVVEGTDSFAAKFAVNDACVAAGVPCVIAGVVRHEGTVLPVRPGQSGCYRCLFESPPDDEWTCAAAGVLGASVAAVAGLAARAALALAAGDDARAGAGEILVYDDTTTAAPPRRVGFAPRPGCPACARRAETLAMQEIP